jgi:lipoprotein Spr/probable lipoprotein NlpC
MDRTLNQLNRYSRRLSQNPRSNKSPSGKRQYSQKYKGFVYPFPEKKPAAPTIPKSYERRQYSRNTPVQTTPSLPERSHVLTNTPSEATHNYNTHSSFDFSRRKVKKALFSQYRNWRGVRYRIGGMSRRGIDCSRFVHLTFRDKFGLSIPKNTRDQSEIGKRIAKFRLRAGDLVFFRTGFRTRHVGIYIKKGRFLHASTSRGVVISNLKDRYWRRRYWKSIRVLQ